MALFQDDRHIRQRLKWLRLGLLLLTGVLLLRLWHLTVVRYEEYRTLAEQNRVRKVPLPAPRGLIYDREGRILVENAPGADLVLYPGEVLHREKTKAFLLEGFSLEEEELEKRLAKGQQYGAFRPVVIKQSISLEEIAFFLAHRSEYPGLEIVQQPRRLYRYGRLAAHLLGYVGEVSAQQLKTEEFKKKRAGDIVGKSGIERSYDAHLAGRDGVEYRLVNSQGRTLQNLERREVAPGRDLHLTLDLDLQMAAEEALGEELGAAVVLSTAGELLAMVSHPSFDPNLFSGRMSLQEWETLLNSAEYPLQNRAIQSAMAPGSIFKVILALAGLQSGVIRKDTLVFCDGGVDLYGRHFGCWQVGGHGLVDVKEALQYSCNVFFYLLGQKLGIERIAQFARRLGLGQATGVRLIGEVSGLVPSQEWKLRTRGQPWFAGETIAVSIGQGPIQATPLQLARSMAAIATGWLPPLRLTLSESPQEPPRQIMEPDAPELEVIRDGLWSAVNEGGTGRAARVSGFAVCGKTGSAQTVSRETRSRLSGAEKELFESNAWFVGFAPRKDPQVVVAVLVQRGGSGGSAAAPVAGKIFEAYFKKYASQPTPLEVAEGKFQESWMR